MTLQTEIATNQGALTTWVNANPTHPNVNDVSNFLDELAYGLNPTPLTTGNAIIDNYSSEIIDKMRQIKRHNARISAHQQTLDDFNNATNMIVSYNQQINQHRNEVAHWDENHVDEFEELLNYWNMLESGRDSHTGKMYSWIGRKSKKQKNFSKTIAPNLIANAMSNSIAYG